MRRRNRPPRRARRFPSLASFYSADAARLRSQEMDVGLWWREGAGGPLHRAAWVADTGELYLVRLGPAGSGAGTVEVLAELDGRERVEELLSGWRERCGEPGSLEWLRRRAARAPRAVRRSPRSGSAKPRFGRLERAQLLGALQ
jgi:hypothetical protein